MKLLNQLKKRISIILWSRDKYRIKSGFTYIFYMDVLTFLNSEHNLNLDTDIAFRIDE